MTEIDFDRECAIGFGKLKFNALQPLLNMGLTILTSDQKHSKVKGAITTFPRLEGNHHNSKIVTGFLSETFGKINLLANVNITSADTTAIVTIQLVTDSGDILSSVTVNPGTFDYSLSASTYTQPGTAYQVQLQ